MSPPSHFSLGSNDQAELILSVSLPRIARHAQAFIDILNDYAPSAPSVALHAVHRLSGVEGLALLAAMPLAQRRLVLETHLSTQDFGVEQKKMLDQLMGVLGNLGDEESPAVMLAKAFPRAVELGNEYYPRTQAADEGYESSGQVRILFEGQDELELHEQAARLSEMSLLLKDQGNYKDALIFIQKAVEMYRSLSSEKNASFYPLLVQNLMYLSARFADMGCHEKALQAAQEAVDSQRKLAKERPDAFLPNLAMSLNNLGVMQRGLGRREEALASTKEAVSLHLSLAKRFPQAFAAPLVKSIANFSRELVENGLSPEAEPLLEEAVRILEQIS